MVISAGRGRAKAMHRARVVAVRLGKLALAAALALSVAVVPADAKKRRVRSAYSPPQSAMLLDAHSGKILYSSNIDEPRYPASVAKVMTLYLVFEQLKEGRIKPETPLKVSAFAAGQAPSKLELEAGSTITVREAMFALVTKSANDAAVVIAENIAGSEPEFARLMTRKAHALGMANTTFRNASGLPDAEQRTTARDLIMLGQRVLADFPEHAKIFQTKVFSYDGEEHRNHNGLLFTYPGTEGLKTGFTQASGFNLLTSVRRDDKHLLAVVLGGPSARERNARMRGLLNQGWDKAVTLASMKARGLPLASAAALKRPGPVANAGILKTAKVEAQAGEADAPKLQPGPAAATMTITEDDLPERNPAFHPDAAERTLTVALASAGGARLAAKDPPPAQKAQPSGLAMFSTASEPAGNGGTETKVATATEEGDAAPAVGTDPANAAGPYHVQVGSYLSVTGAKGQLQAITAKARDVVNGHGELTVAGSVAGKAYYRARFGRFSESEAKSACAKLKTLSIDCLVVRAE